MDFWHVFEAEQVKPEFGSGRLYIASRDRIHLSLSHVERYSILLGMNQGTFRKYSEEQRFIITKDMDHDLFVSIYDVNTTQSALLRFSQPLGDVALKKAVSWARLLKKPNLELRIIGLQDKDTELLNTAERLHSLTKPALMEADLFGAETRHLVFDTKLGMVFNLLLLNRIYRPHELATTVSAEDYGKTKSELVFV
ncbi:MAG: hypothetical protein KGI04_03970 [Candidatus Micrarchaeota archaeon]|nr:hypothetical protein [Candidatus Micrarchaeota archaeon]